MKGFSSSRYLSSYLSGERCDVSMATLHGLSKRCERIPHSGIRKVFNLLDNVRDVINLCIGDPDFNTPEHIVEAAARAAKDGRTHYTANAGEAKLREAIALKLQAENRLKVDPYGEVLVTAGAMEALALTMLAVLDDGDEVIMADPGYPNYAAQVMLAGGVPVAVPVDGREGFVLSVDRIEEKLSNRTKAVILNSPCNPTGSILGSRDLDAIATLALRRGLLVISDEVYEKLVFDGNEHASIASLDGLGENTITINSFSKSYAMTGWRVGYAAGPKEIIQGIIRLQEHVVACASSVSQAAALAAIQGPQEPVLEMVRRYQIRRDFLVQGLSTVPGMICEPPRGTFYLFADIRPSMTDSLNFVEGLITGARVAVTPGAAFGPNGEGYIRICFASSDDALHEAVRRLAAYLSREFPYSKH